MSNWTASINAMLGRTKFYLKIKGDINAPSPGYEVRLQRSENPQDENYPQLDVIYKQKDGVWARVITQMEIKQEIELKKSDLKWLKSIGVKEKKIKIYDTLKEDYETVIVKIYR